MICTKRSKCDLHNHAHPPLCLYMMAFSLVKYDLQKKEVQVFTILLFRLMTAERVMVLT